ncbi:hypothetical protein BJX64DRAFT_283132 [Aspergillus heterothallicus]
MVPENPKSTAWPRKLSTTSGLPIPPPDADKLDKQLAKAINKEDCLAECKPRFKKLG